MVGGGFGPPNGLLLPQHPWLCQGDIFASVPILESDLNDETIDVRVESGPAMLLTHGCALDKKTRAGVLKLERMHFLPLRSTQLLDQGRQDMLRSKPSEIAPSEAFYLGHVGVTESHVLLSEPYYLPAAYFQPSLYELALEDGEAESRMKANHGDTRIGRLTAAHLQLLLDKMNVYWTRRRWQPGGPAEDSAPAPKAP